MTYPPQGDRIELRGLRMLGVIGVLDHEQAAPQPLEVDIDLELDLSTAGTSDDLADTVNYGEVCAQVEAVVERSRFSLLEALAEAIAAEVLDAHVGRCSHCDDPQAPAASASAAADLRRAHHPSTTAVTRSFLALGSNLGDRVGYLRDAIAAIEETGELVGASPVYETEPVGGPDEQGAYLNLVVELDTAASPRELLALCQQLERAAERIRTQHWGPRTLDVDVIWIDGVEVSEPDLVVPHPRLWERRFVLAPLADLAPDLVPPERLVAAHGDVTLLGPLADLS